MNEKLNEQTTVGSNSISSSEWVGSPSEPHLVSVRRFRADLGVVPSTLWRWMKRGWLPTPINIGGRLYLTREQIAEFKRRAQAGEFSASVRPPCPSRRTQS